MILICECFISLGLGVMMMIIIFEVLCLGLVFLGKRMDLFGCFCWSLCENLGYEYQFLLIMNEIDNEYKHSRSFIITKAIFRIILIEML